MKRILIPALALVLAGCSTPAEQPKAGADAAADAAAINTVREDFLAAFNANDAVKVGAVYSENAVVMNPGQPTAQGRSAIVDSNKAMFDQFSAKITLAPLHTTVSGDLAFDEGTYTMELMPKDGKGKPTKEDGRYLVVLQRGAEGWKVIEDIGNNSNPATPAPAPAKGK